MLSKNIIIINGASCSGKTTICKKILEVSKNSFVYVQADRIKDLHLSIFGFNDELKKKWYNKEKDKNYFLAKEVYYDFVFSTAKEILSKNIKAIIDCNIDGDDAKKVGQKFENFRKTYSSLFIGIHCPLEDRLRRFHADLDLNIGEKRRSEENIINQSNVFEANKELYDLSFDSSKLSVDEIVSKILKI